MYHKVGTASICFLLLYVVNSKRSLTKIPWSERNFMLTSGVQLLYNVVLKQKKTDVWVIPIVLFVILLAKICLGWQSTCSILLRYSTVPPHQEYLI